MSEKKDFFKYFDDWYYERKNYQSTAEHAFKKTYSSRSQAMEIFERIADVVSDAVRSFAARPEKNSQERFRIEAQKKLVRKIDQTERRIEKKKKGVVIFSILTIISLVTDGLFFDGFPLTLLFAALAGWKAYNVYDLRQKLQKMMGEYSNFERGEYPVSFDHVTEKTILRHAYNRDGKVYPELLALESELSLSQVEKVLSMCVERRIASIELDAEGKTYYYFSTFDHSDPYANLAS